MEPSLLYRASALAAVALIAGCGPRPAEGPDGPVYDPRLPDPVPVQQVRAYPEAQTGVFLSLADFENAPDAPAGSRQLAHFSVHSSDPGSEPVPQPRFVLNITRTGAGALAVDMQPGMVLRYDVPHVRDWSGYMLLSMAVHCDAARDDLRVRLISEAGSYQAPLRLLQAGWTTVAIDLRKARQAGDFNLENVQAIEISLAQPGNTVRLGIDDILLIDNRRRIEPTPEPMVLRRRGLDWLVDWKPWDRLLVLEESPDGLFRFKRTGTRLQILAPGRQIDPTGAETLDAMGPERIGQVRLRESNALRIQLEQTWYFPNRRGQWARTGVRSIRWLHTLYIDGRWVSHLEINNAAGPGLEQLLIDPPYPAAFAGTNAPVDKLHVADFSGPIGRFSWQMVSPQSRETALLQAGYLQPGTADIAIADREYFAPGDSDKDHFDQSAGAWSFRALRGHCRFRLNPPAGGVIRPVIRVAAAGANPSVSVQGLAIRNLVRLESGDLLFILPGHIERRVWVELTSSP